MSEKHDIWQDPNVKAALREGRSADDIALLSCPKCGEWGYYNQGSHFYCRHCNEGWYCCSEGEEPPEDRQYLYLDEFTTLADAQEVWLGGVSHEENRADRTSAQSAPAT